MGENTEDTGDRTSFTLLRIIFILCIVFVLLDCQSPRTASIALHIVTDLAFIKVGKIFIDSPVSWITLSIWSILFRVERSSAAD